MEEQRMKKIMFALGGSVALIMAGTVYAAGGSAHWGYTGHEGPEHWGELSEEYAMCGMGKNQSPIDIEPEQALDVDLNEIGFKYNEVPLEVVNNGHTIQANYAPGSKITVDGHTYKLLQVHYHTPSENTIENKNYDMEAHLVHADDGGNLAVVAVMFEKGDENPFIAKIWKQMPEKAGVTNRDAGTNINVSEMLPDSKDYYWFNGSLTTPPCSEGVRWMVLKEPVTVSKEQVAKFHGVMHHDNNRPVQALNARKVLK
jgi:carbonic anhydrase